MAKQHQAQGREVVMGPSPPGMLPPQPFPLQKDPGSPAALGPQLQTPHPLLFPDCLKMPQSHCAARWDLLGKTLREQGEMNFPISQSSGFGELAPRDCLGSWGRAARRGAGRSQHTGHAFALGNGSVSVSWVLKIKEKTTKNQARWQLWLRLRIRETGTSMRDCVEEAGAAGNLRLWPEAPLLAAACGQALGLAVGTRRGWLGSLP